ncbi:sodium:solute symporter family protein [Candidatus Lariskella endosymbiont of Hedychridium roseum]|uniref:sodium:solute symporter family protein n=1 Tax=Candidatus Lariskella endosymbiont of Hedychridium roseum TaxID=3077949 RepID=UPI0030CF5971
MGSLNIVDVLIIFTYFVLCVVLALYRSKKIKTITEYTIGSGYFPDTVVLSTIFMTFIGAPQVVGAVGKVYELGLFFAITELTAPLLWFITLIVFAKNINRFSGCISIGDVMALLYGSIGRWVTNIASILISIGLISVQALALGYAIEYFLQVPKVLGMCVGMSILIFYSTFGGIRAVAITDVFQFVILIIAIPIACSFAYRDIGGYSGIMRSVPQGLVVLDLNKENIFLFCSLIFYAILPINSGPYIQRFLMVSSSKQLTHVIKFIPVIHFAFVFIICMIGFIIKGLAPSIDPNNALYYLVDHYTAMGLKGLLVSGILAIIMSSADSWLNTAGVLCAHDIVKRIFPKLTDSNELKIARISTCCIGIIAIVIASISEGILELLWFADNFWYPITIIPLAAGFWGFRTNCKSFFVHLVFAVVCVCIGAYLEGSFSTVSLMFGIVGSAVGLFGMHYWQAYRGTLNITAQPIRFMERVRNEG